MTTAPVAHLYLNTLLLNTLLLSNMDKLKGTLHYDGKFKKISEQYEWYVENIVKKDVPLICDIQDEVMLAQLNSYEELFIEIAALRSDDIAVVVEFVKQYRTDAAATMEAIGVAERPIANFPDLA